jgi:lysophospholipase L1-like esterase
MTVMWISGDGMVLGRTIGVRTAIGAGVMAIAAAAISACGDGGRTDGAVTASDDEVPSEPATPVAALPTASGTVGSATENPNPSALVSGAEGGPSPVAVVSPAGAAEASPTTNPQTVTPGAEAEVPAGAPTNAAEVPIGPEPDVATRARCTGTDRIQCHFGGPPGNYDVTVVLGGTAAASTIVLAETRRTMLGAVATAPGETRQLTFSVNVRQPEGEPIQAVPAGTPGLDLYFIGAAGMPPAVESIGFRPAQDPLVIYVAGDSTVADQTGVDYGGWGQQLPQHFAHPVVVANYADSGESSGSFLNARQLFAAMESLLTQNDWVFIQFGHNDKQVLATDFRANITQLVTRVRAKGASPVLVTPVARAQFNGEQVAVQHVNGVGANLPEIIREVAVEQSVPLLDLTVRTSEWLREVGPNGWQPFHALGTDVTHTNDAGAQVEAQFVREHIIEADIEPLVSRLR